MPVLIVRSRLSCNVTIADIERIFARDIGDVDSRADKKVYLIRLARDQQLLQGEFTDH